MKNLPIIVISSILLTVFGYVFVAHHLDTPDRVKRDRHEQRGGPSGLADRIQPVGQLAVVAAAETRPEPVRTTVAAAPVVVDGQKVYQGTCVACHGAGIAGAPKSGDASAWATRIAKGVNTLYASAIHGLQGATGMMPAKGGNASLSEAEVKAAVDYMVAKSR